MYQNCSQSSVLNKNFLFGKFVTPASLFLEKVNNCGNTEGSKVSSAVGRGDKKEEEEKEDGALIVVGVPASPGLTGLLPPPRSSPGL